MMPRVLQDEVFPADVRKIRPRMGDELLPRLRRKRRDVDAIVEEVEILDHEIDPRGPPNADRVLPRKDSVENNREPQRRSWNSPSYY